MVFIAVVWGENRGVRHGKMQEAKRNNQKTYFTGEPCKKGHIALQKIGRGCIICDKEYHQQYSKKWALDNKEKLAKNNRKYYESNKKILSVKRKQRINYRKELQGE